MKENRGWVDLPRRSAVHPSPYINHKTSGAKYIAKQQEKIMSLATVGGGLGGGMGGGGGLTMAHQASAMAPPTAAGPPPGTSSIPGAAPPSTSVAALGADLVDKQQLSLGQVRDLSKLPIVAVDLYSRDASSHVAGFPPKNDESSSPFLVGKMKDQIALKTNEVSHKTLRKFLSQDKTYRDLQADCLAKLDDKSAVLVSSPQQWLGMRRLSQVPTCIKSKCQIEEDESSSLIAQETSTEIGCRMANSSLDGKSVPQGDDFDRVVVKLKLTDNKKALTVLPEELTSLLLTVARYHVASHHKTKQPKAKDNEDEDEDTIPNYPCALAVPAVDCHDASIEALVDALGGTGVIFQRSVCALEGALLPMPNGQDNALVHLLSSTLQQRHKEHQLKHLKNPEAAPPVNDSMLILLCGMAKDCTEVTAIQLSQPRSDDGMWGDFKVLTNVSYRHAQPEKVIDKCISELFDTLDTVAPEAGTPVAFVSYGSKAEQSTIESKWQKLQKSLEDWEEVPSITTGPETVALGIAVLGAVSHGRLSQIVQVPGKKAKADLAIHVHNVAPCAVGVLMNYHGDDQDKWTAVKTIFDFDRRVPAGPYAMDLVAAECAVHRDHEKAKVEAMSDEELLKAIQSNEGAKFIPKREQAALNLRVQVLQKWTRDGEWIKVGDVMSPLVSLDKDEKKIACEKVVLELSLGATGMITNAVTGERYVVSSLVFVFADLISDGCWLTLHCLSFIFRESVVQANTSARNSKLRYYLGLFLAVAFFGGFLFKSWYEQRVFERDTARLLAYYKNVIPGSMNDGDIHNAQYLVYKYRNKKHKLWKNLEKKYGAAVLEEHEWSDAKVTAEEGDEEEENLDDDQDEESKENKEQEL